MMSEAINYTKVPADDCNGTTEPPISLVPPTAIKGHDPKSKNEEKAKTVGFLDLFRFADRKDKVLMLLGLLCALITGALMPMSMAVFGEMIEVFVKAGWFIHFLDTIEDYLQFINATKEDVLETPGYLNCYEIHTYYSGNVTCHDNSYEKLLDEMMSFTVVFCVLAGLALTMSYGQFTCFLASSERQARRIRQSCLRNVLRQDIGWFDTHNANEINTRLGDEVMKIQNGIGPKVPTAFHWMSCAVYALICGLYYGWQQSLVVMTVFPPVILIAFLLHRVVTAVSKKELQAYAKAGAVAEEVLGAIRTVVAFGGQDKDAQRYRENLSSAKAQGIKKGLVTGISAGFIWGTLFSCFGFGLGYGGKLYRESDDYSIPSAIIVVFSVMNVAFALGNVAPNIQDIATAQGAAYSIFGLIDCEPQIDSSSHEGLRPTSVKGTIQFEDVHFSYPSRPDVKVLNGLSVEAKPGQTVALVGASGCGKTTIVQLLHRFYDPQEGKILIDGHDVKELNVKWLRRNISIVSQEPVLFATTISENIRYGREDATMDDIMKAAKSANAYDFIMALPEKFKTIVGERGSQLSGGQKQRLAIARALVRNPKILLLDEATSALDTENESIVQDALDKARQGRTTVIIAHRLSTIKTADLIVGIADGKVTEIGTHVELMNKQGIYYHLVTSQQRISALGDNNKTSVKEVEDLIQETRTENQTLPTGKDFVETTEEKVEDLPNVPFSRILKLNASEWPFMMLGCLGSLVNGIVMPLFAIAFSSFIKDISKDRSKEDPDEMWFYTLLYVGIGLASFCANILQNYMFGRSGEALTSKLRNLCFLSMLRQDVAYFDDKKNNVGALTYRLHTDASLVQGISGPRLGGIFMSLSCFSTALAVAFVFGWKMALLVVAFIPFMILSGIMMIGLSAGQAGKNKKALENAAKVTVESVGNIRTVASLTKESKFLNLYMENLDEPYRVAMKNCHVIGLTYGFSQAIIYGTYAASFAFGAYLVEQQEMDFDEVFLVFTSVIVGTMGLGFAFSSAPDVGKAQTATKHIFHLFDMEPTLDYTDPSGIKLMGDYKAQLSFKDVKFHYPNRKSVEVLQGMTFALQPGETMALVGSSGCGKSTSVQLIERFYDCVSGLVTLDQHGVKDLNLKWLREQIGIVTQEPLLFDTSIAGNIAYGDNTRAVPMNEIISAARCANIHSFIISLPDGYETNVGSKGTQLSGGQKQRIAIARALVRNPKILLLDEATSALDTENEKIVQEALNKAREGRTCIVIAHRLSTVENADKICVIQHGKVSEIGTHSELMGKQGFYYKLVKRSQRGDNES